MTDRLQTVFNNTLLSQGNSRGRTQLTAGPETATTYGENPNVSIPPDALGCDLKAKPIGRWELTRSIRSQLHLVLSPVSDSDQHQLLHKKVYEPISGYIKSDMPPGKVPS